VFALAASLAFFVALPAGAVRIKDVAAVQGVRDNQLLGYGLVVGLDGTGDYGRAEFTVQSTVSMLSRLGIRVDDGLVQTRNVAAVMVTADLPPFARSGQRLDVTVSSLGNARSLQGGTLVMSPLMGPDGQVYAVAQGSLSLGGYVASDGAGNSRSSTHSNVGRIPEGAIVEQDVSVDLSSQTSIRLILHASDFTTAVAIARRISETFDPSMGASDTSTPFAGIAEAVDASTVRVEVPEPFQAAVPQFISILEDLDVEHDTVARVIVNERTGTVVINGNVTVSEVAVAHGNLNVTIARRSRVAQPNAFGAGTTQVVDDGSVNVNEENAAFVTVAESTTIGEVVAALNALGTSSRDLIAILQAIDAAGALHAELVIQ